MTRWTLPPEKIPSAWFNVTPYLRTPLQPPLHPVTREPVGPDDLAPLFAAALIEQEMTTVPWIDVPVKYSTFCSCGGPPRWCARSAWSKRWVPRPGFTTKTSRALRRAATSRPPPSRRRSTTPVRAYVS